MVQADVDETMRSRAPVRAASQDWVERLTRWNDVLSPRPAWNVCAALVSQHFDEVKRLIDTNRRIGAVWQRHGGPALVRSIVFAETPARSADPCASSPPAACRNCSSICSRC